VSSTDETAKEATTYTERGWEREGERGENVWDRKEEKKRRQTPGSESKGEREEARASAELLWDRPRPCRCLVMALGRSRGPFGAQTDDGQGSRLEEVDRSGGWKEKEERRVTRTKKERDEEFEWAETNRWESGIEGRARIPII